MLSQLVVNATFWGCDNVIMELGKLECLFIREDGLRHQNHMAMNVQVLSNLLTWFYHNVQKEIIKVKRHANLKWDRLQVYFQYTFEVFKPTFVKLAFNHILQLLNMTTWGVGSIPLNI